MKRFLISMFVAIFILSMTSCGKTKPDETVDKPINTLVTEPTENSGRDNQSVEGTDSSDLGQNTDDNTSEETSMKLFINDVEIPVIWEENASVTEIMEEAAKGDIVISMSMYGGNEQVGSLGKQYSSNDKQTTTYNGDIVLYNSSNLVVFYGSNSWAYTRLGKLNLSETEVTELLSNGDVTVTLRDARQLW